MKKNQRGEMRDMIEGEMRNGKMKSKTDKKKEPKKENDKKKKEQNEGLQRKKGTREESSASENEQRNKPNPIPKKRKKEESSASENESKNKHKHATRPKKIRGRRLRFYSISSDDTEEENDPTRQVMQEEDYKVELNKRIEEDFCTAIFFDNEDLWAGSIYVDRIRRQRIYIHMSRDIIPNPTNQFLNNGGGTQDLLMWDPETVKRILLERNRLEQHFSHPDSQIHYRNIHCRRYTRRYGQPGGGQRRQECGWLAINFLLGQVDRRVPETACIDSAQELTRRQRENGIPSPFSFHDEQGNYSFDVLQHVLKKWGCCEVLGLHGNSREHSEAFLEGALNSEGLLGFLCNTNNRHWWSIVKIRDDEFEVQDSLSESLPISNVEQYVMREMTQRNVTCFAVIRDRNMERRQISQNLAAQTQIFENGFWPRWADPARWHPLAGVFITSSMRDCGPLHRSPSASTDFERQRHREEEWIRALVEDGEIDGYLSVDNDTVHINNTTNNQHTNQSFQHQPWGNTNLQYPWNNQPAAGQDHPWLTYQRQIEQQYPLPNHNGNWNLNMGQEQGFENIQYTQYFPNQGVQNNLNDDSQWDEYQRQNWDPNDVEMFPPHPHSSLEERLLRTLQVEEFPNDINHILTTHQTNDYQDEECMICLEEITTDTAVRMFNCRHLLHRVCLIDYINNSNYGCSSRCPSCRQEFQETTISERIQWSNDIQDNNSENTPL